MRKIMRKLTAIFTAILICSVPVFSTQASEDITGGIYCPVLTYHRVTTDQSQVSDWTVTAEKFEKDIKSLLDNGYTPIFSADLVKTDKVIGLIPEKPVIIQFDDGYSSVYELAYPILKKYNVKAEVYPGKIHGPHLGSSGQKRGRSTVCMDMGHDPIIHGKCRGQSQCQRQYRCDERHQNIRKPIRTESEVILQRSFQPRCFQNSFAGSILNRSLKRYLSQYLRRYLKAIF